MLNSDVLYNITLFWENGVLQGTYTNKYVDEQEKHVITK